jgi:hypothetical protein
MPSGKLRVGGDRDAAASPKIEMGQNPSRATRLFQQRSVLRGRASPGPVPRWVDASLLSMAFVMAVIALFMRSNAPFVDRQFAAELGAAQPQPPIATLEALPRNDRDLVDSIDVISEGANHTIVAGRSAFHLGYRSTAPLTIDGWAIDRDAGRPAFGVIALIDGHSVSIVRTGRQRPDVATAFAEPNLVASGFHIELPANAMPSGRHRLSFLLVDARRDATKLVDLKIDIDAHRNGPS